MGPPPGSPLGPRSRFNPVVNPPRVPVGGVNRFRPVRPAPLVPQFIPSKSEPGWLLRWFVGWRARWFSR